MEIANDTIEKIANKMPYIETRMNTGHIKNMQSARDVVEVILNNPDILVDLINSFKKTKLK